VQLDNDQLWALLGVLSPDPGRDPVPVDRLLAALVTHLRRIVTLQTTEPEQHVEEELLNYLAAIGFRRTSGLLSQLRTDWTHRMFLLDEKCCGVWRSIARGEVREVEDEARQEILVAEMQTSEVYEQLSQVEAGVRHARQEESAASAAARAQNAAAGKRMDECAARVATAIGAACHHREGLREAQLWAKTRVSEAEHQLEQLSESAQQFGVVCRHIEFVEERASERRAQTSHIRQQAAAVLLECAAGATTRTLVEEHLEHASADTISREQVLQFNAQAARELRTELDKALFLARKAQEELAASRACRLNARESLVATEATCAAEVRNSLRSSEAQLTEFATARSQSTCSWKQSYLTHGQRTSLAQDGIAKWKQQLYHAGQRETSRRKAHVDAVEQLHTCQARLRRWDERFCAEMQLEQREVNASRATLAQWKEVEEASVAHRVDSLWRKICKDRRNQWYDAGYADRGARCACVAPA